jgi:hypothetical protein
VRELTALASGFTSGAFGSLAAGVFTGVDGVTLEIFMAKILKLVAPDCDGAKTNAL